MTFEEVVAKLSGIWEGKRTDEMDWEQRNDAMRRAEEKFDACEDAVGR
jgi:hypothetical protein